MNNPSRGFTLIELMIVVAIVAILGAIALPTYRDYAIRGKLAEPISTLSDLRTKLEKYYQDERNYGTGTTCGNDGVATRVPMPTTPAVRYFTYTCTTDGQTFTLTASGIASEGTNGFTFTIDHNNQRQTTAVPSGWSGTGSNCWVRSKDGQC